MKILSEKTTIAKNAGALVMADVITIILEALLTITIARKLGVAHFGLLAFAVSFTRLFGFFTRFGFKYLISRDVAKEPDKTGHYLGSILVVKLLLSVAILLVIISILQFTHYDSVKITVIYIAMFVVILDSFIEFLNSFFRAYQKAEYEALVKTILHVLTVTSGLTVLFLGYGVVSLISVRFLVYFFTFVFCFSLVVKKTSKPNFSIQRSHILYLIKSSLPFAMVGVFVVINTQMGTILLSFIKGDEATGWYSAAHRLCGVVGFIPVAFVGAVLPAMSKFSHQNLKHKLIKTYEGTIKSLIIIILPIAVGTSILADHFILMIYGTGFQESIIVLRILIWLLVFSFVNHGFLSAFATINKEKTFVRFQFIGTIIHFCLNISLIPILGVVGVSIAAVFSQMVTFIFSAFFLSKHFHHIRIRDMFMKPASAVLTMGVFLLIFRSLNAIILVLLSIVIYCITLVLFRTFSTDELSIFRELIRKGTIKLAVNR